MRLMDPFSDQKNNIRVYSFALPTIVTARRFITAPGLLFIEYSIFRSVFFSTTMAPIAPQSRRFCLLQDLDAITSCHCQFIEIHMS